MHWPDDFRQALETATMLRMALSDASGETISVELRGKSLQDVRDLMKHCTCDEKPLPPRAEAA